MSSLQNSITRLGYPLVSTVWRAGTWANSNRQVLKGEISCRLQRNNTFTPWACSDIVSCSCTWLCSRWAKDGPHTPLLTIFLLPKTNPKEFQSAVTTTGNPCLTCVQWEMPGQSLLATKRFSTHITGKQLVIKFPRWQSISHLQPQLFCFCAKKHKVILRTLKTCKFHSVEPCRHCTKCSTSAACCVIWHMSSFRKETPSAGKEMNLS